MGIEISGEPIVPAHYANMIFAVFVAGDLELRIVAAQE